MSETSQHSQSVTLSDGREITVAWAGATDTGHRRESNQDAFLAEFPLFLVADGMGGHAGGEIASRATIAEMRALLSAGEVTPGAIEAALKRASDAIVNHPDATDEGTGTTLTGIALADVDGRSQWMTMNIGDSRVYLLREGGIVQLTTDHSVVQELIASGRLSPEEAEGHPYSNVITRAVGASELTVPDYVAIDPHDGDVFVICSDGLTKELTDYGILHFVTSHPQPADAVDAMMTAALDNGGRDNVTIVVARVQMDRDDSSSTSEETIE